MKIRIQTPTLSYAIERDEETNEFVVSDCVVHGYGVGETLDEALADYLSFRGNEESLFLRALRARDSSFPRNDKFGQREKVTQPKTHLSSEVGYLSSEVRYLSCLLGRALDPHRPKETVLGFLVSKKTVSILICESPSTVRLVRSLPATAGAAVRPYAVRLFPVGQIWDQIPEEPAS